MTHGRRFCYLYLCLFIFTRRIAGTVYNEVVYTSDSDIEETLKRLINEYLYRK
ncbi:MAG: hypothetical protein HY883_03175 [Deltaproteobacteria bacterium]|nr:hypothetical protein [Deltaproteobacteria bacterium]